MNLLLKFCGAVALLSLAVGIAIVANDEHLVALSAEQLLADADIAVRTQSANLSFEQQKLDSVLDTVNEAASEQRAYWKKTSADSDKTVKALRLMVDRTALLMKHADESQLLLTTDLDRQINLTGDQAQFALGSISQSGDQLTFMLDDPAISDLAQNLDATSVSLKVTADHFDKTTADIEQEVHRLTRPPSMLKQIGMGILDVGAKLGSIAAGFFH